MPASVAVQRAVGRKVVEGRGKGVDSMTEGLSKQEPAAVEYMSRHEIEELQLERLKRVVGLVWERVPVYREKLEKARVTPEDLKSLSDVSRLPFTTKADFRDTYPFGLLAVPLTDVVRLHASSGTTGKPTIVAYTRRDIDTWSEIMARTLALGGAGREDIVHNAFGYGLFTGGLGFHYGAERLGATVIPMSGGFTERQIKAFTDLGSTVLCCTPSYALHLAEALQEAKVSPDRLKLRVGFFGAEPWTEGMREAIESRLNLAALNIYGLSEVMGPGQAVECLARRGMHVAEDHFLAEVVDPVTLEPVPLGSEGELVLTSLTKEALPVLRYRTRDLTAIEPEPCPCGRSLRRIRRIKGRTDDMLIIRGVNMYPSQIEEVLTRLPEVEPHYLLIVRRERALDTLEINVEPRGELAGMSATAASELAAKVRRKIYDITGVTAEVRLVPPKTLERSVGKAKRVQDLRQSLRA